MSADEWETLPFEVLCDFQNGYAFRNKDYDQEGTDTYVVFRMGNIARGGGLNRSVSQVFISREKCERLERFVLGKNDITMCMTDMKSSMALLGHTALVDKDDTYILNQRVGRITIRRSERLHYRYLFYYTNSPSYIQHLRSVAHSGVQVNLSTTAIKQSPVVLPPLPTQRKIAAILSAYDDLIENNTRRIAILEEMAQTLYREWFVHFRFPGHEQVAMVESTLGPIPEGWKVRTVGQFGDVLTGKTPSKKVSEYYGDYMPFIKIPDMHGRIFCTQTTDNLSGAGADSQKRKTIPPNSLCVSCIGSVGLVAITTVPSQTNQQINSVVLQNEADREFLYFAFVGVEVPPKSCTT